MCRLRADFSDSDIFYFTKRFGVRVDFSDHDYNDLLHFLGHFISWIFLDTILPIFGFQLTSPIAVRVYKIYHDFSGVRATGPNLWNFSGIYFISLIFWGTGAFSDNDKTFHDFSWVRVTDLWYNLINLLGNLVLFHELYGVWVDPLTLAHCLRPNI